MLLTVQVGFLTSQILDFTFLLLEQNGIRKQQNSIWILVLTYLNLHLSNLNSLLRRRLHGLLILTSTTDTLYTTKDLTGIPILLLYLLLPQFVQGMIEQSLESEFTVLTSSDVVMLYNTFLHLVAHQVAQQVNLYIIS